MALPEKNYSFRRASTIEIPDQMFQPYKTGKAEIDDVWSELGGIIPSQVTIATGKPGAGKTTLTLLIASLLPDDLVKAFISLEMSDFQLAHQAKKIKGFGDVYVTEEFDQVETFKVFEQLKPGIIIVDSIQKAARKMRLPNGKEMPFITAQYKITEMFTAYAKKNWCPVILIGHCDKSGNYKGPSDMLHDVDSHLLVSYDKETTIRSYIFDKNRFGGLIEENVFGITKETVWIGSPFNDLSPVNGSSEPTNEQIIFCREALANKWDKTTAKIAIKAIVNFLKNNDENFDSDSCVKDATKVKLIFKGDDVAHCLPLTGELVFGSKALVEMMPGQVGYKKEKPYIALKAKTPFQLLEWIVIHEWCHLFEGMTEHDHPFFNFISKKYAWYQSKMDEIAENMKEEVVEKEEEADDEIYVEPNGNPLYNHEQRQAQIN